MSVFRDLLRKHDGQIPSRRADLRSSESPDSRGMS